MDQLETAKTTQNELYKTKHPGAYAALSEIAIKLKITQTPAETVRHSSQRASSSSSQGYRTSITLWGNTSKKTPSIEQQATNNADDNTYTLPHTLSNESL